MTKTLTESAQQITHALTSSEAYSLQELRAYAANRIRADMEFQETLNDDALLARLIDILAVGV